MTLRLSNSSDDWGRDQHPVSHRSKHINDASRPPLSSIPRLDGTLSARVTATGSQPAATNVT